MSATAWTDDDNSELTELAARGFTGSQIALRMGRSRGAILGKLNRLGVHLPRRHDSKWTKPLALSAWVLVVGQNLDCATAAAQLGNKLTAHDVRVKIWNMKAQRAKRQARYQAAKKTAPARPVRALKPVRLATEAKPLSMTLLDLDAGMCRYPLGGVYEMAQFFCGAPVETGQPYCSPHCAVCFAPRAA